MNCLICDEEAAVIDSMGDYQERACPKCGHYRLTGTAIDILKAHNWKLDVELTRRWLAMSLGTGQIPTIDSNRAASLIQS